MVANNNAAQVLNYPCAAYNEHHGEIDLYRL